MQIDATELNTELAARIVELEAALCPLAAWATILKADTPDGHPLPENVTHLSLTMAHARAASSALKWTK